MIPMIPASAPFSPDQIAWLNGFLAGLLSPAGRPMPAVLEVKRPLLVLFGSQSGNSEALAKKLSKEAAARGFAPRVAGLESVSPGAVAAEKNVLVITSTWGEGEMPDNAADFWDGLNQNGSSPTLAGVNFSVLALGDRNYGDTFCYAGKKLDERLADLGANRIFERVDCDVDYDEPAQGWMKGVLGALGAADLALPTLADASNMASPAEPILPAPPDEAEGSTYTKKRPFPATLLVNRRLNGAASAKDTRHIGFSLEGSGLHYEVGDALGVWPVNCPFVVDAVLAAHGLDAEESVLLPNASKAPLREALIKHYEVRSLLGKPPDGHISAADFIDGLRPLQPRLYSIASSLKAHPGEVHLCVGVVRYEQDGLCHKGVTSTFLAERLAQGEQAGVFLQKAPQFRLPADGGVPVIMVGPGTGIAPFRAFLQERQALGARGKNWLFFGDQHEACDFLYREEISAFQKTGALSRLDLAFSRDQARKIYVQDRMLAEAMSVYRWLEEGAHFYVCGDASRMAKDVEQALLHVIEVIGGKSAEDAKSYLAAMRKTKRYQRDVY